MGALSFTDASRGLHDGLRAAVAEWHITLRELAVLEWLVSGDSNKEIALKLGCSEVSIERRVTALLRKSRCDGRGRLIARFWSALVHRR